MSFLPIVHRELLGACRSAWTYRNRVMAAGIVTIVAGFMFFTGGVFGAGMRQNGQAMFGVLSFFAFVFCLLEGIRKTSDCLSEEKREGTLGLLFLTNLRGYDVVMGKLAANSLNSFYGLLAIMPVLALPLLIGGVLPGEYWRMFLVLLNTLFFSLSAGIWVSSFSRDEQSSMSRTFGLLCLIVIVPAIIPLEVVQLFSPYHSYHLSGSGYYLSHTRDFWISLAVTQLECWGFLALASVTIPNSWQQDKTVEKVATERSGLRQFFKLGFLGSSRMSSREKAATLDRNPIAWLAARDDAYRRSGRSYLIVVTGVAVLSLMASVVAPDEIWAFSIPAFLVINYLFKIRFATLACRCTAEARRNNSLELILTTPLQAGSVVNGLQRANGFFMQRGFNILMVELASVILDLCISMSARDPAENFSIHALPGALIFGGFYIGIFFLDLLAIQYAGAWFGLVNKKESAAVTKTILYILIIPLLTPLGFCFGGIGILLIPLFFMAYYDTRLRNGLRAVVENNYQVPPKAATFPP